jgi:type I restriction enzyme S subunit
VLGADGVKILEPRHDIDARFAFHFLGTIRLPEDAGYSRHFKFLKRETVPVPHSIAEQRRIAAILDKADAIRRKRRQALAEIDALLRATFLDMFGDPATNPHGFTLEPMRKFGRVMTGNTPSRAHPENFGSQIEWIKSDNINEAKYFLTTATEGLSETGQSLGRVVPSGSILVTCIAGSPKSIGTAALADRKVAFNQQINAVITFQPRLSGFLFTQIVLAKRLIQRKSSNAMKGMVTKTEFEEVCIMKPPEEQQRRFSEWFTRFIGTFRKLQAGAETSEEAFRSLSQRAFRGGL